MWILDIMNKGSCQATRIGHLDVETRPQTTPKKACEKPLGKDAATGLDLTRGTLGGMHGPLSVLLARNWATRASCRHLYSVWIRASK